MEKRLGVPRGRTLPVLTLASLLAVCALGTWALAESANYRKDTNGWETQDWPQSGQDSPQPRFVGWFTNALANGSYPGPSQFWTTVGFSFFTNSLSVDLSSGPATTYTGLGIMGEVASIGCPASAKYGSQGVAAAVSTVGIIVLASPASGTYAYPFLPSGSFLFRGTPAMFSDGNVKSSLTTDSSGKALSQDTGTVHVYATASFDGYGDLANLSYSNQHARIVDQAVTVVGAKGSGGSYISLYPGYAQRFDADTGQDTLFGPTLFRDVLYMGTYPTNANPWNQGQLYAVSRDGLGLQWRVNLTIGPGSRPRGPRGQAPPAANEFYGVTTPIAVTEAVIAFGCEGLDEFGQSLHALMAFNTQDHSLRWLAKVDARILPTPAITGGLVIFGTANGRAYAINVSDGSFRWQVGSASRLRYQTAPYNAPEDYADAELYGPAIQANGENAYFSCSDGGVAVFATASGTMSRYLNRITVSANYRDENGRLMLRPLGSKCAPVVIGDSALVVKLGTANTSWDHNGAFLVALPLSDLTMPTITTATPGVSNGASYNAKVWLSPTGRFTRNAGGSLAPQHVERLLPMNGNSWAYAFSNQEYNTSSPMYAYDLVRQVWYVNDPGLTVTADFEGETGGLSLGSGFLFATDYAGHIVMIPSATRFIRQDNTGVTGPFPPPAMGPPAELTPALGPIEVFPNPFNPATAVGHVLKFRNLPDDSVIELWTLAYERVRTLAAASHRAEWDGTNEAGQPVANGVYLYRIQIPGKPTPVTGRIALVRK